jgi:hypothetical protein
MPTTITGKKLEVPVRRLLMGVPLEKAANTSAMADPSALDAFVDYARTQQDFLLLSEARGFGSQSSAGTRHLRPWEAGRWRERSAGVPAAAGRQPVTGFCRRSSGWRERARRPARGASSSAPNGELRAKLARQTARFITICPAHPRTT